MKNLPIFVSFFDIMRAGNYIYVDKTEHIYNLFKTEISHYYFLSRPRRFGKTLLLSTLKELFSGNRALFKGLWIDKSDYAWVEYPVIHLDLSTLAYDTKDNLAESLDGRLEVIARSYGFTLTRRLPQNKLAELIELLASRNRVAVLIDEYDQPIVQYLTHKAQVLEVQSFLRNFYGVLKEMSAYIRAIFITGVSHFSKAPLFSDFNNLDDITLDPRAASLLGYTDEEVDQYFASFIEAAAMKRHLTKEAVRKNINKWYNGYRFSELDLRVYNPFSILYFLHDQKFSNYWFDSGTPSLLVPLIRNQYTSLAEVTEVEISSSDLETFDLEHSPLVPLLFQTGYLTIAGYNQQTNRFKLGYPNFEVEGSFKQFIVEALSHAYSFLITATLTKLKTALQKNDSTYLCTALEQLFAKVPYTLHVDKESYYQALFQFLMSLLSLDSQSDVLTNQGRIDNVLTINNRIYLFEFKSNASAKSALKQILDKRYYQHSLLPAKSLTLVGLSFSHKPHKVTVTYAAQDMNPGNHPAP
jgi:hypothetical protein